MSHRDVLGRTLFLLLVLVAPTNPLSAQDRVEVRGRVYDAESGAGVQNAVVTLEGHGNTLSSEEGTFRFRNVELGDYSLRVEAFGYEDIQAGVQITGDTDLPVPLEVDPFELDSITVVLTTIDFDGRARDPALEVNVMDAEVLSDQGHEERTNTFGRFDLDDVYENVPLRVLIRGFGYLPLDTTFVPDDEERRNFGLNPDPVVQRMLNLRVERLLDRAGDNLYEHRPPLDRVDMGRFQESATLQQVMEWTYPRHILRRIGCFYLDERLVTTREERTHILQSVVKAELGRIELFEFPGFGRLIMARVYTRRFFQRTLGDSRPMKVPSMVAVPVGPPLCT